MSDLLPISVCILVKNEEERLPKCLKALDVFSEIIVLDTGSDDCSVEMAKNFGAKVFESEWKGFSASRREIFNKAEQSWILWLDADEIVTQELKENIREFIQNAGIEIGGAKINRMVYFEGQWIRHGHWFPNWNGRLFRKESWMMEDRAVHESITLTSGKWEKIDGILEHYSFRNWEDYRQRSQKYAKLWAEQKLKEGKKSSLWIAYIHSIWAFIRGFVIKKGFLDGALGVKISGSIASEVLLKYKLLRNIKGSI